MHTRNSLTKVFQEMGFPKATSNKRTETMMWQEKEREYITELARERGSEITIKGEKRPSLSLPEYKEAMREAAEIKAEIEQNNNTISKQNERIISFKEEGDRLSKRNKDLKVEIMSKEEVKKLKLPEPTMFGEYYKVPWDQYRRLVATAKQVDVIKKEYERKEAASAETIRDMGQKIKKLEKKVEDAKKFPLREQLELYSLQKMKKGLEWVVSQLPESKVKNWLEDILRGKDVTIPEITKVRTKNRGIAM